MASWDKFSWIAKLYEISFCDVNVCWVFWAVGGLHFLFHIFFYFHFPFCIVKLYEKKFLWCKCLLGVEGAVWGVTFLFHILFLWCKCLLGVGGGGLHFLTSYFIDFSFSISIVKLYEISFHDVNVCWGWLRFLISYFDVLFSNLYCLAQLNIFYVFFFSCCKYFIVTSLFRVYWRSL